jgi:hypothetical protein
VVLVTAVSAGLGPVAKDCIAVGAIVMAVFVAMAGVTFVLTVVRGYEQKQAGEFVDGFQQGPDSYDDFDPDDFS